MKFKKIIGFIAALTLCTESATAGIINRSVSGVSAADDEYYHHFTFESGEDGWEGRGGAEAAQSGTSSFDGTKSLSVSGRTDSWNGCQITLDSSVLKSGQLFAFSAAVSPAGSSSAEIMLSLQYSVGDEAVYDHIASGIVAGGKWSVISNPGYTIPEDAVDPIMYVETAKGTDDFYTDEIIIGKSGSVTPSLGSGKEQGDLNGDGKINIADFVLIKYYLLDTKLSAPEGADVDGNLKFNIEDCILLNKYLFGTVNEFPEKQIPPEPVEPEKPAFNYNANLQYKAMPGSYKSDCSQAGKVVKLDYKNYSQVSKYANVYLPYGYDENKKYNVFYLMHGGGENQDTIFSDDVNFKRILDNMIMNGDIEPMIVVTPTFNNGAGSDMTQNAQTFYKELVSDLIPAVEGKYSTYAESTSADAIKASRKHRAFGGFSMGGLTTWYCFLNTLDYVAYYMPLSGDCWAGNTPADKAKVVADVVKKSGYTTRDFFVMCATGTKDIAYDALSAQVDEMKKLPDQFDYTSDFSKGNFYFLTCPDATHWWGNVVHYIYDALPYFFHE